MVPYLPPSCPEGFVPEGRGPRRPPRCQASQGGTEGLRDMAVLLVGRGAARILTSLVWGSFLLSALSAQGAEQTSGRSAPRPLPATPLGDPPFPVSFPCLLAGRWLPLSPLPARSPSQPPSLRPRLPPALTGIFLWLSVVSGLHSAAQRLQALCARRTFRVNLGPVWLRGRSSQGALEKPPLPPSSAPAPCPASSPCVPV